MASPFETLHKMLDQERKMGYRNKAIITGVEHIPDTWAVEAVTQVNTTEDRLLIERLAGMMRPYPSLDVAGRAALIEEILSLIADRVEQEAGQPAQGHTVESTPAHITPAEAVIEPEPPIPTAPPPPVKQSAPPQVADLRGLEASVTTLPGIKKTFAERLARLNVSTIGDLLSLYPRRYVDYRTLKTINQLEVGERVTVLGTVWESSVRDSRRGLKIVNCTLSDQTGTIEITWFNKPWLADRLKPGTQITVSGEIDEYLGRLIFREPEWEVVDKRLLHTGRLVPVYPLTEGITQKWLRSLIGDRILARYQPRLPDHLPPERRQHMNLLSLEDAVRQIHFPDNLDRLEAARRRLAFDELLFIQLGVMRQRQAWRSEPGRPVTVSTTLVDAFLASLPFQLTAAQIRSLQDILSDMQRSVPMNRLLQGDVGSGKTIVALAAMLVTAAGGGQSALMVPTEILAEQHYQAITTILARFCEMHPEFDIPVRLLTGSTPAGQRQTIYAEIADGTAKLIVGTHTLIQETVEFNDLRLAIVDEQHRFGVQQRTLLRDKGYHPHVLVMSATPIPRSLALTLYGDLDLSVIDEMPPGRQTIETHWMAPLERERAYTIVRLQIEAGRQAFVICPLVEESESVEAKSAVEEYERLSKEIFPDLRLGLVHGRMKAAEKDAVMKQFRQGELDILVSTAVVEVGIDVPNATVMLVEGANRFGLAQLHQFRGRVGRGAHQSYCLLLADITTEEAKARLRIISETSDGFRLAEEDLRLRGPGEFFGTRQSGLPDIQLARLSDMNLLELAREQAQEIFGEDPQLEQPQHELLAHKVKKFWHQGADPS